MSKAKVGMALGVLGREELATAVAGVLVPKLGLGGAEETLARAVIESARAEELRKFLQFHLNAKVDGDTEAKHVIQTFASACGGGHEAVNERQKRMADAAAKVQ